MVSMVITMLSETIKYETGNSVFCVVFVLLRNSLGERLIRFGTQTLSKMEKETSDICTLYIYLCKHQQKATANWSNEDYETG